MEGAGSGDWGRLRGADTCTGPYNSFQGARLTRGIVIASHGTRGLLKMWRVVKKILLVLVVC